MNLKNLNLIQLRQAQGETQVQVADMLGITERHYQYLEAGTSNGSVRLWEQLATHYNVTLDVIRGRTKLDVVSTVT